MWAAAMEIFGSWPAAVRAAGFSYCTRMHRAPWKWTREKILEKIRELDRKGRLLRISLFAPGMIGAAKREFGSVKGALQVAGIPPPRRKTNWPPERILATLRARAQDGVAPRMARLKRSGIYEAARKTFGSWEEAAQAAGLKPAPRAWKWPREKMLAEVRKLVERGTPLTQNGGFYTSLRRVFGGARAAKKAAGVLEW
jgi:hypothetical protein